MSAYPEHDKLAGVKDQSQAIGEFIDFGGYVLCRPSESGRSFEAVHQSIPRILAEYFQIDLDKIEREKRAMLDALREMNA